MIITNLNSPELALYAKTNKNFDKALAAARDFLKKLPAEGKQEIDGEKVYYSFKPYQTKMPGEAQFESHRRYIDIQVVYEGEEIIRFENMDKLSQTKDYDEVKDCEFFAMSKEFDSVRLSRGELAIIFPGEAHAPCITTSANPTSVSKIVFKVLYED